MLTPRVTENTRNEHLLRRAEAADLAARRAGGTAASQSLTPPAPRLALAAARGGARRAS